MTRVTNITTFDLTLPTGLTIAAGKTRPVRDWDKIKNNNTVKAWLSADVISVEEEEAVAPVEDAPKPKRTRKKPVEKADEAE